MPLATNIAPGQADHAELHNEEREAINTINTAISTILGVGAWVRSDSFNRSAGALGVPDLAWGGGPLDPDEAWVTVSGTPPVIANNRVTDGGDFGIVGLVGRANIEIAATITQLPGSQSVGLIGRMKDATDRGYIATVDQTGKVRLYKRVAGSDTTIDISEEGVFAAGDRLALRLVGQTQTVLVNGSPVLGGRDSDVTGVDTLCGFGGFQYSWSLDDFTAREIVPGLLL